MSKPFHKPEAVEIVEVLSIVPTTSRKGLRIARVKQAGVEFVELRSCNLDERWGPSVTDHRTTIRSAALGRVVAALQAAEAKIEGAK